MSYGGGQVLVNSVPQQFDPIHLITARPTIAFNQISNSANAAVSADPNSFQESEFQNKDFAADYSRSGPKILYATPCSTTASAASSAHPHRRRLQPRPAHLLGPL